MITGAAALGTGAVIAGSIAYGYLLDWITGDPEADLKAYVDSVNRRSMEQAQNELLGSQAMTDRVSGKFNLKGLKQKALSRIAMAQSGGGPEVDQFNQYDEYNPIVMQVAQRLKMSPEQLRDRIDGKRSDRMGGLSSEALEYGRGDF